MNTSAVIMIRGIRMREDVDRVAEFFRPHAELPGFKATLFCAPNSLGPVYDYLDKYPHFFWGIQGWEGSNQELRGYADNQTDYYLNRAVSFGYDPLILPPNNNWDENLLNVASEWVIVHHPTLSPKGPPGVMFFPGPEDKALTGYDPITGDCQLLDRSTYLTFEAICDKKYTQFETPDYYAIESWHDITIVEGESDDDRNQDS